MLIAHSGSVIRLHCTDCRFSTYLPTGNRSKRTLARFIFAGCETLADFPTNSTFWTTKVSQRNGDPFDCRRANLIGRRHRTPSPKGYVVRGRWYRAQIMLPGYGKCGERVQQSKKLGSFLTAGEATQAYRYAIALLDDGRKPPGNPIGSEVVRLLDGLCCRLSDGKIERSLE